ncbi:MAG: hypothetical protein C4584_02045 [Armatimonadetes bacterium]|nr:MAG: hypothetical protein C4584_02045 [Armatimonadota bacterium]
MRKSLLFFVFLVVFIISPKSVLAENEFATGYDVAYDIQPNSTTYVIQKITLRNLTSKYFASNFTLTVGSTTVKDVTASDETGKMETKVENEENKTKITMKFNTQVAGLDKEQTFILKFKSQDFAQTIGRTREVNLPKVPEGTNIERYNVLLSVPISFGDPTSIIPRPVSRSQTFDRLFFNFAKEQLDESGISVNFGTDQIFDFSLKYRLTNDALFPIITSVSLPPDTAYQKVSLTRIIPQPINVTIDDDGNYLAWYRLPRKSKQEVEVNGTAKLLLYPQTDKIPVLSSRQKEILTKGDLYWEKDNPAIKAVLEEIFLDQTVKTNTEKAKLIHRYVVNTLEYDSSRLDSTGMERLGAVTVLNNPDSAVCMEFADLFIALSRAAGIPARELDGFAYSQNPQLRPLSLSEDLLHAWAEYYDEDKGWVMVDPTWENTSGGVDYFNKFDLNHLVLAVRGTSSTAPLTGEDVKVEIASEDFNGKPQVDIKLELPEQVWAGLLSEGTLKIVNKGNVLQDASTAKLSSEVVTILGEKIINIGPIPPFGSATYQIELRSPNSWESIEDNLQVLVAGQKLTKKLIIKPIFMFVPVPVALIGAGVLILSIYGVVLGVHIRRRKNHPSLTSAKSKTN